MKEIYLGEIVNTHGIKGELRIISNFKHKQLVFEKGFSLYVGKDRTKFVINSYRPHKNYDMVMLEGINDINQALLYKGESVYINREDLKIEGYILEDLIDMNVYSEDRFIGIVDEVINNNAHDILVIIKDDKKNLVPLVNEFVKSVDIKQKKISIKEIEGLINEN